MTGAGTILLLEDHALLAESLAIALRARDATVRLLPLDATVDELRAVAAREQDPLVLLDLDLGNGRSGAPLVAPLRTAGARVLIVTGSDDRAAIAAAVGYVHKSQTFDTLVTVTHDAALGRPVLAPEERQRLVAEACAREAEERARRAVLDGLTRTERGVLARLMAGDSAEEIAAARVVSVATTRTQIQAILRKLGVNSQLAAVAAAREAGFQPEESAPAPRASGHPARRAAGMRGHGGSLPRLAH